MRFKKVLARLLGVERSVVERVEYDEQEDAVILSVRPRWRQRDRCGICGLRSARYDQGEGPRRWRALDLDRQRGPRPLSESQALLEPVPRGFVGGRRAR